VTMKIGVVGGGQLGRMLGLAGVAMGFQFRFWDPAEEPPAAEVGEHFRAEFDDCDSAERFAEGLDVITYEFENIPSATIERLQKLCDCRPGPLALAKSQDRAVEKEFFQELGIPVAPWRQVDSLDDLEQAFDALGACILKTRRFGYDGKGQEVIRAKAECEGAWARLSPAPMVAEKKIIFQRELSLVGVRAANGSIATYPLVENEHRSGILHKTVAPAPGVISSLQQSADDMMRRCLNALDYVGVLTIEFFEENGKLMANEMAPRVHNSGHWSIEGAVSSQFENHVRAITGMPLGATAARYPSVMLNCIGSLPDHRAVLQIDAAHFHGYGKSARPGRKVGHITVCHEILFEQRDSAAAFETRVSAVESLVLEASQKLQASSTASDHV